MRDRAWAKAVGDRLLDGVHHSLESLRMRSIASIAEDGRSYLREELDLLLSRRKTKTRKSRSVAFRHYAFHADHHPIHDTLVPMPILSHFLL